MRFPKGCSKKVCLFKKLESLGVFFFSALTEWGGSRKAMPVSGPHRLGQGPFLPQVLALMLTFFWSRFGPSSTISGAVRLGTKPGFCEVRWETVRCFSRSHCSALLPSLCQPTALLLQCGLWAPLLAACSSHHCAPNHSCPPRNPAATAAAHPICLFFLMKGHCKERWPG